MFVITNSEKDIIFRSEYNVGNFASRISSKDMIEMEHRQSLENDRNEECETPTMLKSSYRFLRCLGEGAQGRTYLAEKKDTGELVAVKELKMNSTDAFKGFELFMRESEVLADLDDPGVPKFYERIIPKDGNGSCYIVQEFCQNPSIQSTLDLNVRNAKKCFSVMDVLEIIRSTAEILERLEKNYTPPIVHRDIKPSNILYSKVQGEIRCWLIDFGAVANPQKRSASSTIAGTCGYMAPEQLMGMCTPASDIYSLGMTAVHMLTEEPPWKMPVEGLKIQYEPILRKVRPDLNESVLNLLRMMTDASLDNRIGSAREILDILEKIKGTIEKRNNGISLDGIRYFIVHSPIQFCLCISLVFLGIMMAVVGSSLITDLIYFIPFFLVTFVAIFFVTLGAIEPLCTKWQSLEKEDEDELVKIEKSEKLGHFQDVGIKEFIQTDAIVENISPVECSENKCYVDCVYVLNGVYYSGRYVHTINPDEVLKRGELIKVLVSTKCHQINENENS